MRKSQLFSRLVGTQTEPREAWGPLCCGGLERLKTETPVLASATLHCDDPSAKFPNLSEPQLLHQYKGEMSPIAKLLGGLNEIRKGHDIVRVYAFNSLFFAHLHPFHAPATL